MTTRTPTRTIRRTAAPRRLDWIAALILLCIGAGAFYNVVNTIPPIAGSIAGELSEAAYAQRFFASPNVGAVALLLLSVLITTLGGAWFIVRLIYWRFRPMFEPLKVWRQALWAALFVTIGAWLQLNRALTLIMAALVASALVLLEVYLNVRERQE
ncbi:MAG TPA: hypothetical protein VJG32_04665 [Anaerolineae bacterium]|nr:hypothetical protein [Anaerolineae bacterium]